MWEQKTFLDIDIAPIGKVIPIRPVCVCACVYNVCEGMSSKFKALTIEQENGY